MKKKQWIAGLIVIALVACLLWWGRDRIHFDFHEFLVQLRHVNWLRLALGLGCIYVAYVLRAFRWARLMRWNKPVSGFSLVGTQVIGFTAVALIGRVADPVRPYLVARKTSTELSSQIAIYIVERLFDAGSMALIFSLAMISVPTDEILRVTAHSGMMARLTGHLPWAAPFLARFGGLVLTLCGALFLVLVRLSGGLVAAFLERAFGLFSKNLGQSAGHKVREFRSGLGNLRSFGDFLIVTALSLSMWVLISASYYATCTAFGAPQLASMTVSKCVLLMIASGGASVLQLPILGWFSQIGIVAVAISAILGAPAEAAAACAAALLVVTFLGIVPVGLAWAQFDHVSLRKLAHESEGAALETESGNPGEGN